MPEEKKIEEKTAEEWFDLGINAEYPEKKVEYFTKVLEIDSKRKMKGNDKKGVVNVKFGDVEGKEELYDDSGKMLLQEVANMKEVLLKILCLLGPGCEKYYG